MEVIINGKHYTPSQPRIAVAMITHRRPDLAQKNYAKWAERSPAGTPIIVVDDGSPKPPDCATLILPENRGIAAASNAALGELMKTKADHFFLVNDDVEPTGEDWHRPYTDAGEPHLMRIFTRNHWPKVLHQDENVTAYTAPRGCFLYVQRHVVDAVGGFYEGYGRYGGEHVDWSRRIHEAGHTAFMWQDATQAHSIDCLDDGGRIKSTMDSAGKADLEASYGVYESRAGDTDYVGYGWRDVVVGSWFTTKTDPQRNQKAKASLDPVKAWAGSSSKWGDPILFTDVDASLDNADVNVVNPHTGVYGERWVHAYRWLRDHPEVRFAWLTDTTDVTCLHDPFTIQRGTLYTGSEPALVGMEWMRAHHTGRQYETLWSEHSHKPLLNAGLLGGERHIVMDVVSRIMRILFDQDPHSQVEHNPDELDMAAFNLAAYESGYPIITGDTVHTRFRANEKSTFSMWAHK